MLKKVLIGSIVFVALYAGLVQFQILVTQKAGRGTGIASKKETDTSHKVYSFSFSKYTPEGAKEIEIEGDSADILATTVYLSNVVAKAYAEEVPVTMTADKGNYDKARNKVHLHENVVATTADGARLLTEELDIDPTEKLMETQVGVQVKKDNTTITIIKIKKTSTTIKIIIIITTIIIIITEKITNI